MAELLLIGIGAGDPDWITVAGTKSIGRLDVVFVVTKEDGLDELVEARRVLLDRYGNDPRLVELADPPRPWGSAPDYDAAVARWRAQRLDAWSGAIASLGPDEVGGFLVWGDPGLFESTLAIVRSALKAMVGAPTLTVLPGVSSVMALAAAHQVPLNRQGRPVQITPARLIASGVPDGVDDLVVMLDGHQTFALIDPTGWDIYWGAYLGTPDQLLVSGDLAQVRDEILRVRADAASRKGWVFDIYLLRRR